MNRRPPPIFATWLLQHVGNQYQRDALIGDLIEEYHSGRSQAWYWRQVGLALLANSYEALRRRPPPVSAVAKWLYIVLILSGGTFGCRWTVPPASASEAVTPEAVAFASADKTLHGFVYKPSGPGPFPTVLYNHGASAGLLNNQAFDLIGPLLNARGWAFFAPYRRGQGTSSDAGPYVMDEIETARARGGQELGARTMARLLSTEQLQDQLAALAWLKRQPFVRPTQIAVMGNSFGGIETVLGAEHPGYCAAVDAAGAAESWDGAPDLQRLMLHAAQHSTVPIFFFQAENDFNLAPSRTLYAAMKRLNKPAEIRIYPPYGDGPDGGHSLPYRGASIWIDDAVRFLNTHCKP
jgi:carboxymethylenebutenolidase